MDAPDILNDNQTADFHTVQLLGNVAESEMEVDQAHLPELRYVWVTQPSVPDDTVSDDGYVDVVETIQVEEIMVIEGDMEIRIPQPSTQVNAADQDQEVIIPDRSTNTTTVKVSVQVDEVTLEVFKQEEESVGEYTVTAEEGVPIVPADSGVMEASEVFESSLPSTPFKEKSISADHTDQPMKEVADQGKNEDKVSEEAREEGKDSAVVFASLTEGQIFGEADQGPSTMEEKDKALTLDSGMLVKTDLANLDQDERSAETLNPIEAVALAQGVDQLKEKSSDTESDVEKEGTDLPKQEDKKDIQVGKDGEVQRFIPSSIFVDDGPVEEIARPKDEVLAITEELTTATSTLEGELQSLQETGKTEEDDRPSKSSSSTEHSESGPAEPVSAISAQAVTTKEVVDDITEETVEAITKSQGGVLIAEEETKGEGVQEQQKAALVSPLVSADETILITVHGPSNILSSPTTNAASLISDLSSDPPSLIKDTNDNPNPISSSSDIPDILTTSTPFGLLVSESPIGQTTSSDQPIIPLEPLPVSAPFVETAKVFDTSHQATVPPVEVHDSLISSGVVLDPPSVAEPVRSPPSTDDPITKSTFPLKESRIIPRPTFSTSALPAPISAISSLGLKRKNSLQNLFSAMPVPIKRKKVELRPKVVEVAETSPAITTEDNTETLSYPEHHHDDYDVNDLFENDNHHDLQSWTDDHSPEPSHEPSPDGINMNENQTQLQGDQEPESVSDVVESNEDATKGQWRVGRLPGHMGSHIRRPEVDDLASDGETGFKRGKKRSLGQSITESVEKVLKKPFRLPARVILKSSLKPRIRSSSPPPALPSSPLTQDSTATSSPLKNNSNTSNNTPRISSRPFTVPRKTDKTSSMSPPSSTSTYNPVTPSSQPKDTSPINFKASPTYSKRLSKPFKTPFTRSTAPSPHSASIRSKGRSVREQLVELETEERTLRNAIKYHTQPEEDERLVELIKMWRESGQTVAELLFDVYPKPDPNDPMGAGGLDGATGSDNSFFAAQVDYTPEQSRAISRMSTNSNGDKVDDEGNVFGASGGIVRQGSEGENQDESGIREDGSNAPQIDMTEWNIGTMLAKMGVQADMYGWDVEAEDWCHFEED